MIDSLSYIYIAMYFLDLYDGLTTTVDLILGISCFVCPISSIAYIAWKSESEYDHERFYKICKKIIKYSFISLIFTGVFSVLVPSKNTVKVFFGVKAAQSVAHYVDDTNIPERTKKTVNNLWNRVDSYLTNIDIDSTIISTVDSTLSSAKTSIDSTAKETIEQTIKN